MNTKLKELNNLNKDNLLTIKKILEEDNACERLNIIIRKKPILYSEIL